MINTCGPTWNQSFVYSPLRAVDLRTRVLEVTVWDYDRYGANEFLGEVTIDLNGAVGGQRQAEAAAERAAAVWAATAEEQQPLWHALNTYQGDHASVS